MSPQEFLRFCTEKGYSLESIHQFEQAIAVAHQHLQHQKRLAGDSYFDHNLRVAHILADNYSAPEVVLAALLRRVPADETAKFDSQTQKLLLGVDEIKELKFKNQKLAAEAMRKLILATIRDVRIIQIRLAGKLDNLRDLHLLPPEEQQRIAQEALDVYAPLAYRLGMEKIRTELEDHALQILHPDKYQEIANFLQRSQEQRNKDIKDGIHYITEISKDLPLLNIKGRSKHIYSIYKKITHRGVNLRDQYDLFGIRILVPEVKDCYTLLGKLHEHFQPLAGRLKDYIANPKPNMYQSVHTGIRLPNGKTYEVQIRTPEMDEFAEEGIAAHWRYKGVKSDQFFEKKISWLRGILELQKEAKTKEFLEAAKVDIFGDVIYCYTPKGDAKELPQGARVLDFAYAVHQHIGDHAVGARVNGKFVPLKYELSSGDIVEIQTNKNQRPHRSWVKIVKSARARQKIRKALTDYEKLAPMHFRVMKPEMAEDSSVLAESPEFPAALCTLAKCCYPLPGEDIVGIPTKRRVISVHQHDCRDAQKEEERWVTVRWKNSFAQRMRFQVQADERSGLLADLLHTIATAGFEVKEAKGKLLDLGRALCSFVVVPRDLEQVKELISRVQKVKGVKKIWFE